MSDQYAMMMGLDLTDEERMRLMADSLRGKQQAADFFSLSTVPTISTAANQRVEDLQENAKQVGVLKKALEERQSREEQSELDRQNRLQVSNSYGRGGRRGGKQYSYVQPMRGPDGETVLMGLNADTGEMEPVRGADDYKPKPLTSSQAGSLMERAYARMDPTLELVGAVEELDDLLEEHAGGNPRKVPGLTFTDKLPVIGGLSRLTKDVFSGEGEAGDIYSAVRGVMNTIIRNQAGLTQTITELKNVREQTGMDPMNDPQVFFKNLPRIKAALERDLVRQRNTMAPEVVDQIESEYEAIGEQSPFGHVFRRHSWEQPKGSTDFAGALFDKVMPEEQATKPISEMTEEEIRRELGE